MCEVPYGDFGLSIEKSEGKLKFDLSDHLSEERIERDSVLSNSSIKT
jgi:hypothetical protein